MLISPSDFGFESFLKVVGMRRDSQDVRSGTKRRARPFVAMLQGLFLMLSLGGCLLSGEKPDPALDIPQAYDGGPKNPALAEVAVPALDWWRGFRSKELTQAIEEPPQANLDIAADGARIR